MTIHYHTQERIVQTSTEIEIFLWNLNESPRKIKNIKAVRFATETKSREPKGENNGTEKHN